MKPSEVLREARNVLFERGWTRCEEMDGFGRVCLAGAVRVARWGDDWAAHGIPRSMRPLLAAAISEDCKPGWIRNWNDQHGRTFDEVIDVLDREEKIAEQRESDA